MCSSPLVKMQGDAELPARCTHWFTGTGLVSVPPRTPSATKPALKPAAALTVEVHNCLNRPIAGKLSVAAPAGDGVDGAEAGVAAPASAASAVQVSAPSAMLSRLPIDLVVNSTRFDNGRVDFRDRFIRPNYSAQLSELNGTIGRLDSRTRDMATLQFSGRVAGTGGGRRDPQVFGRNQFGRVSRTVEGVGAVQALQEEVAQRLGA